MPEVKLTPMPVRTLAQGTPSIRPGTKMLKPLLPMSKPQRGFALTPGSTSVRETPCSVTSTRVVATKLVATLLAVATLMRRLLAIGGAADSLSMATLLGAVLLTLLRGPQIARTSSLTPRMSATHSAR